jgi:hypothetical protein
MALKTAFAAVLAVTASSAALADVLVVRDARPACKISTSTIRSTADVRVAPVTDAQPRLDQVRWTWIPVQAPTESPRTAALVAIPVPAPGAAALIGLAGLIVSHRRAS